MKKILFSLTMFLMLSISVALIGEEVESLKVKKVFDPYSADFIITEEQVTQNDTGEVDDTVAEECGIYGVTTCYDNDKIRFDIFLQNGASLKYKTWYGMVIGYSNGKEYYLYYPTDKKMFYIFENTDGEITSKEEINVKNSVDTAGITDSTVSGEMIKNSAVYLIIDKSKHFQGRKGESYKIGVNFESGYDTESGEMITVTSTEEVEVAFIK